MGIVKSKAINVYYIVRASRFKESGDNQLQQGQDDLAAQSYRNCLSYAELALEDDHAFLLSTYQNLGMICWKQHNYEEAISNLKKVETALSKTPEEQALNISKFNDIMGTVYDEFSKYEEAVQCFKKAIQFAEKLPDMVNELPSMNYKAGMALMHFGKRQEAAPYLEKAQDLWLEREIQDPEIYGHLARISEIQDNNEDTMVYYKKGLELKASKGEGEDLEGARFIYGIAECYQKENKIDEALKNYEKCLQIRIKELGEDRELVAGTYHTMGNLKMEERKLEEAEKLLYKAMEIRVKVAGEESEETARSYDALGQVYREQGKAKEAMEYYKKALEVKEKVYGQDSGEVADTYFGIGQTYHKEGKDDEAWDYYVKAEKISEKVFGEKNLHVASVYFSMGLVLLKKLKAKEGLERIGLCYEIRRKHLGDKHVLTLEAGDFLKTFMENMEKNIPNAGEEVEE